MSLQVAAEDESTAHAAVQSIDDSVLDTHSPHVDRLQPHAPRLQPRSTTTTRASSHHPNPNPNPNPNQVLDAHNYDASIKLGGTILRRQLLLLLKLRVWEGVNSPRTVREEYVGSFVSCKDLAIASMRDGLQAQ